MGFVNFGAGKAKVLLMAIRVYFGTLCLVAGFSRGVHEIFGLLRCNATYMGIVIPRRFGTTYRSRLQGLSRNGNNYANVRRVISQKSEDLKSVLFWS